MARPNKTFDSWVDEFREVHGDRYEYISITDDKRKVVTLRCPEHDRISEVTAYPHLRGARPACCVPPSRRKLTPEEWEIRLKVLYGDSYTYQDWDIQNGTVNVFCPKHFAFSTSRLIYLMRGTGPTCCAQERKRTARLLPPELRKVSYTPVGKRTEAQWIEVFHEIHGHDFTDYRFEDGWVPHDDAKDSRFTCVCTHCGHRITRRVRNHLRRDTRRTRRALCPNCKSKPQS